jgi:hypothetical protein
MLPGRQGIPGQHIPQAGHGTARLLDAASRQHRGRAGTEHNPLQPSRRE